MKIKSKKKSTRRSVVSSKNKMKGAANNGALYVVGVIAIVATFGAIMAGGAIPTVDKLKTPPPPGPSYTCCDSGNGAACHPITTNEITYNGDTYALLKSNIVSKEGTTHIAPASPNQYTPDGHRIFVGTSDTTANYAQISGCENGKELIRIFPTPGSQYHTCFGIPANEIIYVCKDTAAVCNGQIQAKVTPFDAYFRVKDGPVPAQLTTMCPVPSGSLNATGQQLINVPTPAGKQNLQLQTFQVMQQQGPYIWDDQFCKPAINLYPTQVTSVHVQVAPQGKLNYTNPLYPANGWDVTAYPNGAIVNDNKPYPYLYWEAAIPDALINQPSNGYAVAYSELKALLQSILPQLGLNVRETNQFTDYWTKALPKSNYYFVGVMPQSAIDVIAPLTITPKPDSILRLDLYFKALDQKMNVTPPQSTSFERKGFTVTEWGGFFKADKNHPNFTCLM